MATDFKITQRDLADFAKFKKLLSGLRARTRADCIEMGQVIWQNFERKKKAGLLQHNRKGEYALKYWGEDVDYLGRFVRLVRVGPEIIKAADDLQAKLGWKNDMTAEPQRTCALLHWYNETLRPKPAETARLSQAFRDSITERWQVLTGDCRKLLLGLPEKSFQAVMTSPPYHLLRNYGHDDQIGLELRLIDYIAVLVQDVFRPIKALLADDGVLWVNMGDRVSRLVTPPEYRADWNGVNRPGQSVRDVGPVGSWLQIPARFAEAMKNDGWLLRSDIVWEKHKASTTPKRQPQPAHESIFMFTKSTNYRYDKEAVTEPVLSGKMQTRHGRRNGRLPITRDRKGITNIWHIQQVGTPHAGVTAWPIELAERMLLLSTRPGDRILDPFGGGAATAGIAAQKHGRDATLIEVNPEFAELARHGLGLTVPIKENESGEAIDEAAD